MTAKITDQDTINEAARQVLDLAISSLLVRFRFLDVALNRLEITPSDSAPLATDGVRLMYEPKAVLRSFIQDREKPSRDFLHIVLHCIFSHMFTGDSVDRKLWDLACDAAVDNIIGELGFYSGEASKRSDQVSELSRLREEIGVLTAEKIYRFYRESALPEFEIERLSRLFRADDHSIWYAGKPGMSGNTPPPPQPGNLQNDNDAYANEFLSEEDPDAQDIPVSEEKLSLPIEDLQDLMDEWRKIADKIKDDLETFSKERGDSAGDLMQNLRSVTREKYDYADFLRKFAVLGEHMTVNEDEFDYIFYMYGFELYDNMPLVEPLEYKEVKRIREFVIAIDTSASTSGELVQSFLRKTYNILKTGESYFTRVNIHIVQCDADIREHVRITSEEEFDDYIETMAIHGLGGTDFRPVFELVDSLIDSGELSDLKGLIYFTDGRGIYPARKPGYETAFVFLDNEYNMPEVPPWAIKLVLQDKNILS